MQKRFKKVKKKTNKLEYPKILVLYKGKNMSVPVCYCFNTVLFYTLYVHIFAFPLYTRIYKTNVPFYILS